MIQSAARVTRTQKKPVQRFADNIHRFSVDDYHRMIDAGILTPDHKVELLDGWIINKMPQKPSHSSTVQRSSDVLEGVLPAGWIVRAQFPITLTESEPEPDIAVARGEKKDYYDRHPRSADLGLLVEVSRGSLVKDRVEKGPLYAQAKIPEYWIINISAGEVEVYSRLRNGRIPKYSHAKVYGKGDEIPLVLDGVLIARIPVKDLVR